MSRRHNFQTVSWFYDLHKRRMLDMDPPYQRRSVWNQNFKDYFVDTVLLNFPAPALFLYEEIGADGRAAYHVVDGKQRLMTLFEFIDGRFTISERSDSTANRGKYFSGLDDETKKAFWAYQFLVEYVPSSDENLINSIFDRINRNVAKLTPQELRHAKLDGEFITTAENLAEWTFAELPRNFPRIASQSQKQMKDVEFIALLLLLIEEGPQSYSQDALDKAFSDRDEGWERRQEIETQYRRLIRTVKEVVETPEGEGLTGSRFRNQTDFYSLLGALHALPDVPAPGVIAERLTTFLQRLEDPETRKADANLTAYYEAARSASNDKGPREVRIERLRVVIGDQR